MTGQAQEFNNMTENIALPNALHRIGLEGDAWAIDTDQLERLIGQGQRAFERLCEKGAPSALEAYKAGRAARGARVGVRGGVGVVYVEGPLVKIDTWLSGALGLTTYESLRRDLQVLLDEDRLKAILLRVDSPGGEVNGCDELARAIYDNRKKKPIYAYVSGQACSAAYWIASAAEKVIVSDLAMLGSIGVTMAFANRSKRDEAAGIVRHNFVSSNAPNKAPDPETRRGQDQYQKVVDTLANVFVSYVARHRGVSAQTVIDKFGMGGVEVGAKAVAKGMADEIGQFEQVLARLQKGATQPTKSVAHSTTAAPAASVAPIIAAAPPKPSAEELARAAAQAEAERKAEIDQMWKRAAERANAGLGPNAVKSG